MGQYLIGDILLEMDYGGIPVTPGKYLERFQHQGLWAGEHISFTAKTEPLEQFLDHPIRPDNGVYVPCQVGQEQVLIYHWGRIFKGFGIWPDRFSCSFAPEMMHQIPLNTDWFFGVCGFHRQLLRRGASVFHGAYIGAAGKAILFSAASQTGKSTQAALWERFAGAEIINGDRVLLRRMEERWYACGYPCCGSSDICLNRTMPLGAIVVLEQAPENAVLPMTAGQKVRALAAAMEFYPWDREEMDMVFELAMELAARVPVIRLRCRPDADAVQVLKDYLTEEGIVHDI